MFANTGATAQVDVKVDPFGIILNSPKVSAEYIFTNSLSMNGKIGTEYGRRSENGDQYINGFSIEVGPRYYFRPQKIADRFYFQWSIKYGYATYRPFDNQSLAFGYNNIQVSTFISTGYKWIDNKRILVDIGFGIGRHIINDFKLSNGEAVDINNQLLELKGNVFVGYRLFKKSNELTEP